MDELKEKLKVDIKQFEKTCKSLGIGSMEYNYWNGCRCQAEVTLNHIKEIEDRKTKVG